jgi:hypothetical protein
LVRTAARRASRLTEPAPDHASSKVFRQPFEGEERGSFVTPDYRFDWQALERALLKLGQD